jgi:uncharacterized protein YkwD
VVRTKQGRHAADRPGHGRRVAAVAVPAVVALALAGWALTGRGGDPTGTAARIGTAAVVGGAADRDGAPAALAPQEGGLYPAPSPTATVRATTVAPTATRTAVPTSAVPSTAVPTSGAPSPSGDPVADEVTRLVNAERAKAGCAPVKTDARLAAAALAHSRDMVDRNYFSHTSPDGKGPGDRAAAAGYPSWSGENIAAGYPTPAEVVQGWMNSPGHKANILNCQSKATGVGFDPRQNMWTQMFGFV